MSHYSEDGLAGSLVGERAGGKEDNGEGGKVKGEEGTKGKGSSKGSDRGR